MPQQLGVGVKGADRCGRARALGSQPWPRRWFPELLPTIRLWYSRRGCLFTFGALATDAEGGVYYSEEAYNESLRRLCLSPPPVKESLSI